MKSFGSDVIAELKSHGEFGEYFTYEEYAEIPHLVTPADFSDFAKRHGYHHLIGLNSPDKIRWALRDRQFRSHMKWYAGLSILDIFLAPFAWVFHILIALLGALLGLLSHAYEKRKNNRLQQSDVEPPRTPRAGHSGPQR